MHRIGIDLGGTKIEGVVLDQTGREILRKRIATEREQGYQHILNRLKSMHDDLVAAMQEIFPNVQVEKWNGHGHFLMVEDPQRFNQTLQSFLAGQ